MTRASSQFWIVAIILHFLHCSFCSAQTVHCPYTKYPNSMTGTCSWYCKTCNVPGGKMAYLPCSRQPGGCDPLNNCLSLPLHKSASGSLTEKVRELGGTGILVHEDLKFGYSGPLQPRYERPSPPDVENSDSSEETTGRVTVLHVKELLVGVRCGEVTDYIVAQALRLKFEITIIEGDRRQEIVAYTWRILETEGRPRQPGDFEFHQGTLTEFPGVFVVSLPNAEKDPAEGEATPYLVLRHERPHQVSNAPEYRIPTPVRVCPPAAASRRQLRQLRRCR